MQNYIKIDNQYIVKMKAKSNFIIEKVHFKSRYSETKTLVLQITNISGDTKNIIFKYKELTLYAFRNAILACGNFRFDGNKTLLKEILDNEVKQCNQYLQ